MARPRARAKPRGKYYPKKSNYDPDRKREINQDPRDPAPDGTQFGLAPKRAQAAITYKPAQRPAFCADCGGREFWQLSGGRWMCKACNPRKNNPVPAPAICETCGGCDFWFYADGGYYCTNCQPKEKFIQTGFYDGAPSVNPLAREGGEIRIEGPVEDIYTPQLAPKIEAEINGIIAVKEKATRITQAPEHGLIKQLRHARRLSHEVIGTFGIEPWKSGGMWGWKYPAPMGGDRWKNADSKKHPKYTWIPSKPAEATIYHAPDLLQAIDAAGGVIWYVTEADVWTLRAAGIKNAMSAFTETAPAGLGDMLVSMGVTHVMIAPDQDKTGLGFAQRVKAELWGTPIDLTCLALPFPEDSGGDIGRAWVGYDRPEPFLYWLMGLPRVEIADPEPVHETPAPDYSITDTDPLAAMRQAITARLGVRSFNADGFSAKNIACLFHDDQNPSASLHVEKGLYCHACQQWYTWKALAEALGIPWTFTTVTNTYTAGRLGIVGMSREARRALISQGLTNLARALDILYTCDLGGSDLTFREFRGIVKAGLKAKALRVAWEHLQGKNLPAKVKVSFCPFFSLPILQPKESKKKVKNSKRGRAEGRPEQAVRIPTEQELNAALDVAPANYYGMDLHLVIGDPARYRAEALADEVRRKPGKYARAQLAAPLGISYPTIKAYCERAGIDRQPNPPKLTELKPEEIAALPANYRALRLEILKKHIAPNVYLQDERGNRHAYTQAGAQQSASMNGGKLYRAEYQASTYTPKGERSGNA